MPHAIALRLPQIAYGRTLARAITPEAAQEIVDELRLRRGRGSVTVILTASERPDRFDVDAVVRDLSPEHAIQILQIALARTASVNGIELEPLRPIAAADYDRLSETAERIVDRCRSFGAFKRLFGGIVRFFPAPASFRYTRERMVAEVIAALNEQRGVGVEKAA